MMRLAKYTLSLIICLSAYMVYAQPIANFTANKISGCSPLTVSFTNTSTGNPTSYLWRLGNGNTSTLKDASATYVNPGTYKVVLVAINAAGTDSIVKNNYITVFANPTANFSNVVTSGCAPLTVTFNNTSTQGSSAITQYLWDFGDGNLSTSASPSHIYTTSGIRTVSLTVTDANGCQHSITKTTAVTITQTQTVNFSGTNLTACKPPVTSNFTSTVTPTGTYTYLWTTSNGLTSTQQNPQFTFGTSGNFDVTLKVINGAGCAETVVKKGMVTVRNVQASFTTQSVCAGKPVVLTNTSTPDTSTAKYIWKRNGVQIDTSKHKTENNLPPGNYNYDLTIIAHGCTSTVVVPVQVHPKPTVSFTSNPSGLCQVPITVNFTNTSSGAGNTYFWSFGNGQYSSDLNPSTVYTTLTSHNVKLVVESAYGCKDSLTKVIGPKQINADILLRNKKEGCSPVTANFRLDPSKQTTFATYEWKYKNVVISSDSMFTRVFNDTGKHVVTLKVITDDGCELTLVDTIKVGMKIPVRFTADKRNDCYRTINPVTFTSFTGVNHPDIKYEWKVYNPLLIGGSADKNPAINFYDTGFYDVRLTVDLYGCKNDTFAEDYIYVKPAIANFEKPSVECGNRNIQFNDLSKGRNKIIWYFGDGDSSNHRNPEHYYDSAGIYSVLLVAIDTVTGCLDSMRKVVVIADGPKVDFSPKDTAGCAPFLVRFKDLTTLGSTGFGIVSRQWIVNGTQTYTATNPTIIFSNPGYYSIRLTVRDAQNCVYTYKKDSAVRVFGGGAKIGLNATSGCVPFLCEATDSSITDLPVVSRKWVWQTGDSIITPNKATTYVFNKTATPSQNIGFNVALTVTDSFGCKFTTTRRVVPTSPQANINLTRNFSCESQAINFSAPITPDKVCGPANVVWNIQGINTTSPSTSKTFSFKDTSLVIALKVTDSIGCIANKDTSLRIINKRPILGFYGNPRSLACFKPVIPIRLFDTTIVGSTPIAKWEWRVGTHPPSDKQHPSFTFPQPGKYPVKFKITDSAGCVDSAHIPDYVVIGGPYGTFNITLTQGCVPHTSIFEVNSPNAKYAIWDFADGLVDTVTADSFSYLYQRPGLYYPAITLVDSSGTCENGYDSLSRIEVFDLPKPDFNSDKNVVCINTNITFNNSTPNKPKINNWLWQISPSFNSNILGPVQRLFPTPGKYIVQLTAVDTNGCSDSIIKPDFITVTDDTIPPDVPTTLAASVVDNERNQFTFTRNSEPDFVAYWVNYNFYQGVASNTSNKNDIEDTIFYQGNINTLENPYSYSVSAIDVCKNLSKPSTIHTTVELKTKPVVNAITLNWTPYGGFDSINRYEIWRNNADSGNTFVYINSVPPDSLNYNDTSITCFTTYYYKIRTIEHEGNKQISWSDTSGAVPVYVPTMPSTKNIRATVVDDSYVLLQWEKRTHEIGFKYLVYKTRDNETTPIETIEITNDTFLVDKKVDVDNHSYTYTTYLKDECGGLSATSNIAKTILLKVELKQNDIFTYDPIIWFSKYQGWQYGVSSYKADFFDEAVNAYQTVTTLAENDTTFFHQYVNLNQRDYCYKVAASENSGNNQVSESNEACIETKPRLFAPNVFTINGDGINDRFRLGGVFVDTYHIAIYDRWGKLVYESTDLNASWDGLVDGTPAPVDVYVYIAEGTGRKNQRISIKGNVTLLR